jgi:DNA-3-methyladenine glycosylase
MSGELGRSFFVSAQVQGTPLLREFYTRPNVLAVARQLLGKLLVVFAPDGTRVSGLIVETEAYRGPADRASHAYGGRRTARTETMYQIGGTAYVYFVYGMYHQFNVVTNVRDVPHAVLIRALEPVEGIALMRERRPGQSDCNLANGPGKLCIALTIDRTFDRVDLLGDRVRIEDLGRRIPPSLIACGPRIGIDYAERWAEKPWRFWIKDNQFVSYLGRARGILAERNRAVSAPSVPSSLDEPRNAAL